MGKSAKRRKRPARRDLAARQRRIRTRLPLMSARGWRDPTPAEEQEVDRTLRMRGAFVFSDTLTKYQQAYGFDPERVWKIPVSPLMGPLGAWYHLVKVRARLEHYREIRRQLDVPADIEERSQAEATIARLERDESRRLQAARAGALDLLGAGGTQRQRWTTPPSESDAFWSRDYADVAVDDFWADPNKWPWLRQLAAKLDDYLRTTRLVNPRRPYHLQKGAARYSRSVLAVTAELVQGFYRSYFPRFRFTATDVKRAVDTAFPPTRKTTPR